MCHETNRRATTHFTWTRVELGFDLVIAFTCTRRAWVRPELTTQVRPCSGVGLNPFTEVQQQDPRVKKWRNADWPGATKRSQLYWRSGQTKISRRSCLGQYVTYRAIAGEHRKQIALLTILHGNFVSIPCGYRLWKLEASIIGPFVWPKQFFAAVDMRGNKNN